MEGSEEQSSTKPRIDDDEHRQSQEQVLGLQFSLPCDPNFYPNLDTQSIDDKLKQIVAQELENLILKEAVHEEVQSLACEQAINSDSILDPQPIEDKLKKIVAQELENLVLTEAVNEDVLSLAWKQAIEEVVAANQYRTEELHHQALRPVIDEALESRALKKSEAQDNGRGLKEDDKAATDNEPEKIPVLEETEVNEKSSNVVEKENDNEDRNGRDEVKDEDLIQYYGENLSKNENDGGNGRDEVKEEDRINNYDNNWSKNDIEDRNGRDEVKDEDGIKYNEDVMNEDEEEVDGYNKNGNYGGDSVAVAVSKDGTYRRYTYPLRPDAEDCPYYMRTGMCKFGSNCKFNHPLRRKNQASKETVRQKEENPERPGQTECKYYMTSGGCKFGKACRYNHNRGRTAVAPIQEVNFLGLPIRPGERECPYYMRNGSCKYGSNCRFNHPDPTTVGGSDHPSGYVNDGSVTLQGAPQTTMPSWSSPRTLNKMAPFVPLVYSPSQVVPSPDTEWNGYQAPVYPTSETSLPTPPAFTMQNPATDANFYTHHQQQMLVEEFPERPGQPECSYFLKTGDCKYRSGCKFHHPKSRIPITPAFVLSDKGLPLRPDQHVCTHYSRYGICKFGPGCKYDHPLNYGNSASSVGSGPDQPPPPFSNSATAGGARMAWSLNGSF